MPSVPQRTRATEVLSRVRISGVFEALTRTKPRRTGRDTYRAPATWRGGDGDNVALDDSRGVWRDFVTDDGGGVLDLVMRVLGCSRADALRWCADLAGVTLDETPSSPEDRARWARERRGFECELSDARYWRRTVIVLLEELLDSLKAAFFGPSEGERPSGFELRDVTQQLERLRRLDGAALVGEYADWKRDFPRLTAGMVWAASTLYAAERRAVEHYLAATDVHTA